MQHILQGSQRLKKTYKIESLPPYIIFHVKRFTRNNFFTEKNPTIVNFPVKNLELREYLNLDESIPTEEELANMWVSYIYIFLTCDVKAMIWVANCCLVWLTANLP